MTDKILAEVARNPGLTNVDTDLKLNKPELSVAVNRDKSSDTGVQIETVGRTLETMLGGRQVTRYKQDGEQYDVIVQVANADRSRPDDIGDIYVRGKNGAMIPLANLVDIDERVSPRELNHFGQRRSASITANLAPDYSLGEALAFLDQAAAKVLQPGYTTDLNGTSREFRNAQGALLIRTATGVERLLSGDVQLLRAR